jgi:hypothetical protein
MSRFPSPLKTTKGNPSQSPPRQFRARTEQASHVLSVLGKHGFRINELVERHIQIRIHLSCGAIVSVYTTGTVLVQGRIHGCGAREAADTLRAILPEPLIWQARVDD